MLDINKLNFTYPHSTKKTLHHIDFKVQKGEVVSIIGESGSGKSTLLKLIYGLLDFDEGEIFFGEKRLKGPLFNLIPGHSMMKYVAQDYDLLDFVTVSENVGKFLSNFDLLRKQQLISQALEVVNMNSLKDEFPNKLSGGQRQRVAIARALAQQPELLLLDEPFSNLDQTLKLTIREKIIDWCKEHGITVIFTTHDLHDAFYTSDKMLVMQQGKILQFDEVERVREQPKNSYVAQLFGYVNLLNQAQISSFSDVESSAETLTLIYPEEIQIDPKGIYQGTVVRSKFQGRDYLIKFRTGSTELLTYSTQKYSADENINFTLSTNRKIGG